jgi:DNA-binding NarL/FixJ family response regulator
MTNKQIAQDLHIAEDTVKKHLQHIYRKVGVHRRALLMIADRARRSKTTPGGE